MYYVIGQSGERFGPADFDTLKQWVAEGRLLPTMIIESVVDGKQMPASQLSGLIAHPMTVPPTVTPPSSPYQTPGSPYQPPHTPTHQPISPTTSNYPRNDGTSNATNPLTAGWICFGIGVFLCPMPCISLISIALFAVGVVIGSREKKAGREGAYALLVSSSIALGIAVLFMLFLLGLGMVGSQS